MELNKKNMFKEAGIHLAEFRKKLEYSRGQMAAYLGLNNNAYYKKETGISLPSFDTLYQLAMKNNLSLDWFFFNRGPMNYDEKEKSQEIELLKAQLEQAQKKLLELEKDKGQQNQKEMMATTHIKPEIKELIEAMELTPLLYYEILAKYQRFKIENKALIEKKE